MSVQRGLLLLSLAAGIVAGVLYYAGSQRVTVLVASRDLAAGERLGAADLEVRGLPPDAIGDEVVTEAERPVGLFLRVPLAKGQLLVASAIARAPAAFESGVAPPTGYRAVSIPVTADHALGGAIVAGSRVDVIAVPRPDRAAGERGAELLVPAALVLDVRGEQGGAFERGAPDRRPATALRERLGSVVVAVGPLDEIRVADRIATSIFVLALVPPVP